MLLRCSWCNAEFEKRKAEYNRRIKIDPNIKFFCSRSCSVSNGNSVTPRGVTKHLKRGSSLDEYPPFRYFVRKARNRKHDYNVDLEYIKELWEQQNGMCAISGIKMILHKKTEDWEKDTDNPYKPSFDRIDSSKGYIKGNVRFVTYIANMCKQSWSDEVVIEFCKKAAKHNE